MGNRKIVILLLLFIALIIGVVMAFSTFDNAQAPTISNQQIEPDNESAIRDYITKNISQLSPEKETLGGTFYITNVNFLSVDTATVSYEDGHNAYTAKFNYSINNGVVSITNFAIGPHEENQSGTTSFNETGTVVGGPRMFEHWSFIYEGNGGAPIKIELVFNEKSLCKSGASEIECFAISTDQFIKPNDTVHIEGRQDGNSIIVTSPNWPIS